MYASFELCKMLYDLTWLYYSGSGSFWHDDGQQPHLCNVTAHPDEVHSRWGKDIYPAYDLNYLVTIVPIDMLHRFGIQTDTKDGIKGYTVYFQMHSELEVESVFSKNIVDALCIALVDLANIGWVKSNKPLKDEY